MLSEPMEVSPTWHEPRVERPHQRLKEQVKVQAAAGAKLAALSPLFLYFALAHRNGNYGQASEDTA